MKNYISLSKKALLLGGAFVMFTSCDDGDLADIYKGSSSGEYVSDVNWTEAANKSTETYIKYFFENAGGRNTFAGEIYWEKPNTPALRFPVYSVFPSKCFRKRYPVRWHSHRNI